MCVTYKSISTVISILCITALVRVDFDSPPFLRTFRMALARGGGADFRVRIGVVVGIGI